MVSSLGAGHDGDLDGFHWDKNIELHKQINKKTQAFPPKIKKHPYLQKKNRVVQLDYKSEKVLVTVHLSDSAAVAMLNVPSESKNEKDQQQKLAT